MAKKKLSSDMIAFMRELILQEKTKVAQDPDIKSRPGTQPKKYHKGLSKSTKAARDAHFKKNDDYGPAPGDKGAKTKKSKHTKKFEKMFGETIKEMPAGRSERDTLKFNNLPKALKDKMIIRYGEPKFDGKHDFLSSDGDTLFKATEKNTETGSISHKIIKLPSFSKLYSDWTDLMADIKALRKNPDINSDKKARELFDQMKDNWNALQKYLREERPEQYELMKMRRDYSESVNEMAYEDIPCPACGDPNCDHKADHMHEQVEVVKQKLSKLDYKFLNSYFEAEKFSAPNPDDSLRQINNERDWDSWKAGTMEKYGDVDVELNKDEAWFSKFKIIDTEFMKDKKSYTDAKGRALDNWRKTSNYGLDEALDHNDPVMIKLRQAQMKRAEREKLDQMKRDASKKASKEDKVKDNIKKLQLAKDQLLRKMENDPSVEPEGGERADYYGGLLNKIDKAIARERSKLDIPMDYDTAVGKLNEFLGGDLKNRNQVLFDKLVPGSGDSEFVEGEMIRAMNRIVYRWYNDGDRFWEGYGTETAGPAHSFLVNSNEIPIEERRRFEKLFDAVVGKYGDEVYEKMLDELAEAVLSYVESIPEDQYQKLEKGMFNYEPEYEEDPYEDDDDYDEYDDYDEEDDDYYQEGVTEGKEDEALKNKAEKANAPLGALRAIYNKGLAAFKSGHRPGANQHQWAMARVNSVLTGGPARKTDDAQWKQIQKFRKNKKKK
jgi:hypothetical protein